MSYNECSPDTVMGDILGEASLRDPNISAEALGELGGKGLSAFAARNIKDTASSLDDLPLTIDKPIIDKQVGFWKNFSNQFKDTYKSADGGVVQQASYMSVFHEAMTPASVLGHEIVDAVDEVSMQLLQRGIVDGSEYKNALKRVFSELDTVELTDSQRIYYEKWKADRFNGLLMRRSKTRLVNKVDTLSKGAVIASPTVIMGNFVEPFLKGIPLYGNHFFKGMSNLIKERGYRGLFEEIPELAEQGLYGLDIGDVAPDKGIIEKFAGALDRPSKNLMYYVGLSKGGTELAGRKAIQDVLFLPTLANTPLVYRTPESRAAVRLLSYSIGTTQMFHDVLKGAILKPTPETMTTAASLLGMYGLMGGIPYYLKEQGEDVGDIPMIGGMWKVAADVSEIAIVDRIGIPVSIFNNVVANPIKKVAGVFSGDTDLEAVDYWKAAAAMTYMGLAPGSSAERLLSNNQFRKAVKTSINVITGEEEAGDAFTQAFVPGFKEE